MELAGMPRQRLGMLLIMLAVLLLQAIPTGAAAGGRFAALGSMPQAPEPSALPNADFSYAPTTPVVGETITFTSTTTGGTPPYKFFNWTFGDGTIGTGTPVTKAYTNTGTFSVVLLVTDSANATDTRTRNVEVRARVSVSFTFSPAAPAAGETVSFTATPAGGWGTYSYVWVWGDGTPSGTGRTPTHTYGAAATFTVTVTITDSGNPVHTNSTSRQITVSGAINADFTYAPARPQVRENITFTATASGGTPPYTYEWTFGDATSATGITVVHAYTNPGTPTVTLTVSDSATPKHVRSVPKQVTVTAALAANFTFAPTSPQILEPVSFTATAAGGTTPYSYSWTFGDGGSESGRTPSHTYTTAGTFTVTLTVFDSAGHVTTVAKFVIVSGPLAVTFTYTPPKPMAGERVSFSATATGGRAPYTLRWEFGDRGTATGGNVSHTYAASGNYIVNVTVTDAFARTARNTQIVVVTNVLAGNFTNAPTLPTAGENITFQATATGGTPPYTYRWDFGDLSTAVGVTVVHAYASGGSFPVTLNVSDSAGHFVRVPKQIVVTGSFFATVVISQPAPMIAELVTFRANATGGTGPYTYNWDFGDGGTANGANVTHAYARNGTFTLTLVVFDSAQHTFTFRRAVDVTPRLAVDFTSSPAQPGVGDAVTFVLNATGGTSPYVVAWDFGDGGRGAGEIVSHAFAAALVYVVRVDVADAANHRLNVSKLLAIGAAFGLRVAFAPVRPEILEAVTFTAEVAGGVGPYTFEWDFGDGGTAAAFEVSHRYASPGTYFVNVTAHDSASHVANTTLSIAVTPRLAVGFSTGPAMPIAGRPVIFSATVLGGTPPYTYNWTFGDGTTSTEPQATHQYAGNPFLATYPVVLEVCDSAGHCVQAGADVTLMDWPLLIYVAGAVVFVLILARWLIRRYRRSTW